MKMIIAVLWFVGLLALGIIIPNMVAKGMDVPIDIISIVGVILLVLSIAIGFIGKNNTDDE